MGLFDSWNETKRMKEAAKQMWDLLKRGYNFEVPLLFDKNDLTVRAIVELQRRHPQVQLRMYQSRGMVMGLFRGEGQRGNVSVSDDVLNLLNKSGHIGQGYTTMKAEDLLGSHEAFLLSQHLDPKQQEKDSQAERAARDAISVGGHEDALDVPAQARKQPTEAEVALAAAASDTLPVSPSTDGAAK